MSPPKVLVVEDSLIVAIDVEETLRAEGYDVVGPAATLRRGLELAAAPGLSAALLDVNLGGEQVFPIAAKLREQNIPFIFLTGYDADSSFPETFKGSPCLQKPVENNELLKELSHLCSDSD